MGDKALLRQRPLLWAAFGRGLTGYLCEPRTAKYQVGAISFLVFQAIGNPAGAFANGRGRVHALAGCDEGGDTS